MRRIPSESINHRPLDQVARAVDCGPQLELNLIMTEAKIWSAVDILEAGRQYQFPALLLAAAELDVFSHLKSGAQTAEEVANRLNYDRRGLETLLDALTAASLLIKTGGRYALAGGLAGLLTEGGEGSVLGMVRHQANCLRRWAQLARVVQTGSGPEPLATVRGESGDLESFIEAMHNVSAPVADEVIRAIEPLRFTAVLDVGGASGTWTISFLRACGAGRAVLFDLPEVIPLAARRIRESEFSSRVSLVGGDYLKDPMPGGCDLAWLSAIVHQNSMTENEALFRRVHAALLPGGRLAIRDLVMEEDRVHPQAGAFFAVNMLVGTERGGTYTFAELASALEKAGFTAIKLARKDSGMQGIIVAAKSK